MEREHEVAKEVEETLRKLNAIWIRQKEEEPHFLYPPKRHTKGWINMDLVTKSPRILKRCAELLLTKLEKEGITKEKVDAIVSSAPGYFGYLVALLLDVDFVWMQEKEGKQIFTGKFVLPKGTKVLLIEDMFKLSNVMQVKQEIIMKNRHVEFVSSEVDGKIVVGTIVHRPSMLPKKYREYKPLALLEIPIPTYYEEDCPYCREGSPVIDPPRRYWGEFVKDWKKYIEKQGIKKSTKE